MSLGDIITRTAPMKKRSLSPCKDCGHQEGPDPLLFLIFFLPAAATILLHSPNVVFSLPIKSWVSSNPTPRDCGKGLSRTRALSQGSNEAWVVRGPGPQAWFFCP